VCGPPHDRRKSRARRFGDPESTVRGIDPFQRSLSVTRSRGTEFVPVGWSGSGRGAPRTWSRSLPAWKAATASYPNR
jgi:hypothetical protein